MTAIGFLESQLTLQHNQFLLGIKVFSCSELHEQNTTLSMKHWFQNQYPKVRFYHFHKPHSYFASKMNLGSYIAQKMKFSINDFFSKCDQIRRKLQDLVTFTEEILNGKLHFLCSAITKNHMPKSSWFICNR